MTTLLILIAIYLLPFIIAMLRRHPNRWPIFWTVLFFGWTLIGWAGAFIWAFTNPPAAPKRAGLFSRLFKRTT